MAVVPETRMGAMTKVTMTITREYEMDDQRVLGEPGFDPPEGTLADEHVTAWLKDSFFELCGWDRDEDHVDGSYVRLIDESGETEWEFRR